MSEDNPLERLAIILPPNTYVNSITLSVKDEDGELFNLNGLSLEFELDIDKFLLYNVNCINAYKLVSFSNL